MGRRPRRSTRWARMAQGQQDDRMVRFAPKKKKKKKALRHPQRSFEMNRKCATGGKHVVGRQIQPPQPARDLRLICALFFIPHLFAKFFVPEALGSSSRPVQSTGDLDVHRRRHRDPADARARLRHLHPLCRLIASSICSSPAPRPTRSPRSGSGSSAASNIACSGCDLVAVVGMMT